MYKIVRMKALNDQVKLYEIEAPLVAKKAQAGQFVVLRADELGERVPFTIAEADPARGTVTVIVQEVGKTTRLLWNKNAGTGAGADTGAGYVQDFVGPLGLPTHFEPVERAVVIGGGLGSAIAYPQAKNLSSRGVAVDTIVGFRSRGLVILEDEMRAASARLIVTTDDGSYGEKGFVTDALSRLLGESSGAYGLVIAIGPPVMMRAVCALTKPLGIKTIVSLNPIMIDGTGMCGCCRVTVGGKTKFACVDGPDFDGHEVDFDELMKRNAMYRAEEKTSADAYANSHVCKLEVAANGNA